METKKYRRGDVHPETGLFFWGLQKKGGKCREIWLTAEKLARYRRKMMESVIRWQKSDPVRHRAAQARLRARHGKERNARCRNYRRLWKITRIKTDPLYRLKTYTSRRILIALQRSGRRKTKPTLLMLGCTIPQLKTHLESQFKPGMNWGNQGNEGWHIDHRIPLSSAKTEEQMLTLFHYTNLQPLWKTDNLKKSDKLPHEL